MTQPVFSDAAARAKYLHEGICQMEGANPRCRRNYKRATQIFQTCMEPDFEPELQAEARFRLAQCLSYQGQHDLAREQIGGYEALAQLFMESLPPLTIIQCELLAAIVHERAGQTAGTGAEIYAELWRRTPPMVHKLRADIANRLCLHFLKAGSTPGSDRRPHEDILDALLKARQWADSANAEIELADHKDPLVLHALPAIKARIAFVHGYLARIYFDHAELWLGEPCIQAQFCRQKAVLDGPWWQSPRACWFYIRAAWAYLRCKLF